MTGARTRDWWARLLVLGVVLLGSLGYLSVRALGGAELVNITVTPAGRVIAFHDVRLWLLAALLAAIVALLNWGLAERRAGILGDTLRRERGAARADDDARLGQRLAEDEVAQLRDELADERARHADLQAAWRSEHEWGEELRRRIAGLGPAPASSDGFQAVAASVLALTLMLVEAGMGVLVAGGRVVAAEGIADDAAMALAERFAGGLPVGTAGSTTRWDAPDQAAHPGLPGAEATNAPGTPPDAGVRNALAIPVGPIAGSPAAIVCANRTGGFEGLDEDVLRAVGDRAGAVLAAARI